MNSKFVNKIKWKKTFRTDQKMVRTGQKAKYICILHMTIDQLLNFKENETLTFFQENINVMKTLFLLFLDGIFYMLQNVFSFTVIAMVAPLSYSVANAMKRLVIIGASLFLLRNPVTTMNVVGMLVACFGVLCYNKVII